MPKRITYIPGSDIPRTPALRDRAGRVVDDAYVHDAVEDAIRQVRGRGRPSLSKTGESPLLRVRVSPELDEAVRRAAEAAGTTRPDWIRQVLSDATRHAS
jgi:predicted HicB family RNase H-like nuclease